MDHSDDSHQHSVLGDTLPSGDQTFFSLLETLSSFEMSIAQFDGVGVSIVVAGSVLTLTDTRFSQCGESITFKGLDADGRYLEFVQHYSQVNVRFINASAEGLLA